MCSMTDLMMIKKNKKMTGLYIGIKRGIFADEIMILFLHVNTHCQT